LTGMSMCSGFSGAGMMGLNFKIRYALVLAVVPALLA